MPVAPSPLPPSGNLWKELGIEVARFADAILLAGTIGFARRIAGIVARILSAAEPPMRDADLAACYPEQDGILWVHDEEGRRAFLSQVLLIDPAAAPAASAIRVEKMDEPFVPSALAPGALDWYRAAARARERPQFFDGKNARLVSWDAPGSRLVFQKCSYFDYLQTNMALDLEVPPLGTLRSTCARGGVLEPLERSLLANSTGINGLVFASDGHFVFQERDRSVLIRPEELCPGFSGTVDWKDVEHALPAGGRLSDLDAPREMVEELGIDDCEIAPIQFLGITRELVRGGTPEFFYAVDVDLPVRAILERIPSDREGRVLSANFFDLGHVRPRDPAMLESSFWTLVRHLRKQGRGRVSLPLLTNLVLWLRLNCPGMTGQDRMPSP